MGRFAGVKVMSVPIKLHIPMLELGIVLGSSMINSGPLISCGNAIFVWDVISPLLHSSYKR